jgi:2-polyprenyl-3-methyl-5-hydroxy-6-metoxy-1,4-benzoquinol methylase
MEIMNRFQFWWRYFRQRTPWDTGIVPPEIIGLAELLPPGNALDLGCGTGTTSVYLAGRGWRVTGIDFVSMAIQKAKQRTKNTHMRIDFHTADVTEIDFLTTSYDWVIDVGCLHGLNTEQQTLYAAQVRRLTHLGSAYSLYAFAPRLFNGRQMGLTSSDLQKWFGDVFTIESEVHGQDTGNRGDSAWYMLKRVRD